ncbi:hypothetical protein [Nitrospirillum amazonense]|nr:hypothetical protein [Nitrospirillum amazonense]
MMEYNRPIDKFARRSLLVGCILVAGITIFIAANTLFVGQKKESVAALAAELKTVSTSLHDAQTTGQPTEKLMERSGKIIEKLTLLADRGDPAACIQVAALKFGIAQTELKPSGTGPANPQKGKSLIVDALKYARCALDQKQALTADEQAVAERWVTGFPQLITQLDNSPAVKTYYVRGGDLACSDLMQMANYLMTSGYAVGK